VLIHAVAADAVLNTTLNKQIAALRVAYCSDTESTLHSVILKVLSS
jgi:hypothetical protein